MLLLSRKQNERIFIDDGPDKIEVCVVDICGDTVRLGFSARRDIPILRGELVDRGKTHE